MTNEEVQQIAALLQPMQNQMVEMQKQLDHLTQEVVKTNLTIENTIQPQINVIFDKINSIDGKLEETPTREEIEIESGRLDVLESIVKKLSREVSQLKKAQ